MKSIIKMLPVFLPLFSSTMVVAAETVTYTYDAKGRLVTVVRSGGPNNTATTTYQHDKADNRKNVTTTGAPR